MKLLKSFIATVILSLLIGGCVYSIYLEEMGVKVVRYFIWGGIGIFLFGFFWFMIHGAMYHEGDAL